MRACRHDFDKPVQLWKSSMESCMLTPESGEFGDPTSYMIVGDNLDKNFHPRHMTLDKQVHSEHVSLFWSEESCCQ